MLRFGRSGADPKLFHPQQRLAILSRFGLWWQFLNGGLGLGLRGAVRWSKLGVHTR